MKRVLTVACHLPGGFGEYVSFDSRASLLDADFVLFYASLENPSWVSQLSHSESERVTQAIAHWRSELAAVLKTRNTVFVLMGPLEKVELTGGIVVTNYDVFHPLINKDVGVAEGTSMHLNSRESILNDYWLQFGDECQYRLYLRDLGPLTPVVTTRRGDRVVGAILRNANAGTLVALPWLDLERMEWVDWDDDGEQSWTSEATAWGTRYIKTLESLDVAIRSQHDKTTAPQWARDESLRTAKEMALSRDLLEIRAELVDLEKRRQQVEQDLAEAGSLKALLFEKGPPLERAVLEATRLLDFQAKNYRDSDSEFDVVLECAEGRCIGEVEGRDNKPIAIDKMRQLEINVLEDLDREEVSEPAKAILFGNAFRLTPPSDRPVEHFTAKCVSAAERTNTALVRTCDLFEVVRALVDKPDPKFAASCRKAILNTSGEEVKFPKQPEPGTTKQGNDPS